MFLLDAAASAAPMMFSLGEVAQFIVVAAMIGGLAATVRILGKRVDKQDEKIDANKKDTDDAVKSSESRMLLLIERMEERHERREERFLGAIDGLRDGVTNLATELKALVSGHEARISVMEKERREK